MLLDKTKGFTDFPARKAGVLRQFDGRLKPEFGLTILPLDMHMHSRLFPREEVEPEPAFTENRRTHVRNDTRRGC